MKFLALSPRLWRKTTVCVCPAVGSIMVIVLGSIFVVSLMATGRWQVGSTMGEQREKNALDALIRFR